MLGAKAQANGEVDFRWIRGENVQPILHVFPKNLEEQDYPKLKTLFYYHGGGMVFGDPRPVAFATAKNLKNYQVFAVKYRKSPEFPYPTPINDCIDATKFLLKNSNKFKINKFGIFGESAGGNLTTAVLMSIDFEKEFGKGKIPEVANILIPMQQAINFKTYSRTCEKYSELEIPGKMVPTCWLAYAGLDVCCKDNVEFLAANRHVEFEEYKSLLDENLWHLDPEDLKQHDSHTKITIDYSNPEQNLGINPQIWYADKNKTKQVTKRNKYHNIKDTLKKLLQSNSNPDLPPFSPGTVSNEKLNFATKNCRKIYVTVSELDPVRDDGIMFFNRIKHFGSNVELVLNRNAGHIFMYMNQYVMKMGLGYEAYNEPMRVMFRNLEF